MGNRETERVNPDTCDYCGCPLEPEDQYCPYCGIEIEKIRKPAARSGNSGCLGTLVGLISLVAALLLLFRP